MSTNPRFASETTTGPKWRERTLFWIVGIVLVLGIVWWAASAAGNQNPMSNNAAGTRGITSGTTIRGTAAPAGHEDVVRPGPKTPGTAMGTLNTESGGNSTSGQSRGTTQGAGGSGLGDSGASAGH